MKDKAMTTPSILGLVLVLVSFIGDEIYVGLLKAEVTNCETRKNMLIIRTGSVEQQRAHENAQNLQSCDQAAPRGLNAIQSAWNTEEKIYYQSMHKEVEIDQSLKIVLDAFKGDNHEERILMKRSDLEQQTKDAWNTLLSPRISWRLAVQRGGDAGEASNAICRAPSTFSTLDQQVTDLLTNARTALETEQSESQQKYEKWRHVVWATCGIGWILIIVGAKQRSHRTAAQE